MPPKKGGGGKGDKLDGITRIAIVNADRRGQERESGVAAVGRRPTL